MDKRHVKYAHCGTFKKLVVLSIGSTVATVFFFLYTHIFTYHSIGKQIRQSPYLTGKFEMNTRLTLNNYSITDTGSVTLNVLHVPKVIYMLWDTGWTNAPPLQKMCLRSVQRHNADFTIKLMNLTEAETLINRSEHYPDRVWNAMRIEAKSDIIRVEILARYGGIWADATIYCNEPLSNWLNGSLLAANFLCFERRDKNVKPEKSPWIASWFLVASNDSYMASAWRQRMRQAWNKEPLPPSYLGYYWAHRLFRDLVIMDSKFRKLFNTMPFKGAGGPHCSGPKDVIQHVYKFGGTCKVMSEILLDKENITQYRK